MFRFQLPRKMTCLASVSALFVLLPNFIAAQTLHVVPGKDTGGSGTSDDPFRDPHQALAAADKLRKSSDAPEVTVVFGGGTYHLDKPLAPGAGNPSERPLILRPAPGKQAVFSMGTPVALSAFTPVDDAGLLERMAPEARGKIVRIDLSAHGIALSQAPDNFDGNQWLEVLHDGARLPISRWPNSGYARMGEVLDKGLPPSPSGGTFRYPDDRAARWQTASADGSLWLRGFWRVPWTRQAMRVAKIDAGQKTITLARPIHLGIGSKYGKTHGGKHGEEQWQAINLMEEIDQPGEWSVDPKSGFLYLWPPPGAAEFLLCHRREPIISILGGSDITLRDLDLDGSFGPCLVIEKGSGVVVENCRIRNCGEAGVVISGGTGHAVLACEITATGREGIRFTGGDRRTLSPGGHRISNNHIHRTGAHTPAPALVAGSGRKSETVGNLVSHNRIHDVPNSGIVYAGNDNIFEFNEIYRVGLGSGDLGGIYTNAAWTARGNIIRHNFIHHSMNANALYMDDGSCDALMEGNILWKTQSGAFIGGGHDQIVRHNLILECSRALHIDSRGVSRNYSMENHGFADDLRSVPYTDEPWKSRYPELARILDQDTRLPRNVRIEHNLLAGCEAALRKSGLEDHFAGLLLNANEEMPSAAAFIDTATMTIRIPENLRDRAAALPWAKTIGRAGLVRDAHRKSIPPRDIDLLRNADTNRTFDSQTDIDASNRK
jgi:hypothetical protein